MTVTPTSSGSTDTASSAASIGAEDFAAAAGQNLSVSGDSIDTGRYVITASQDYTRAASYGGGTGNDGAVMVFDKETDTFVQVFGDPHVATSGGDSAEFQQDGLVLDLNDGTQIQFQPTDMVGGVAHINAVSVTKNDETSFVTGVYPSDGYISVAVSGPVQGNAFELNSSFDDYSDTVMTAGTSLADLHFENGSALDSKSSQMSLDGIGGGVDEFLDQRVPMTEINAAIAAASDVVSGSSAGVVAPADAVA